MDKNRKRSSKVKELNCNVCGKKIVKEHGVFKEDMFEAQKEWGYFSKYDLEVHRFNICEDCHDKMVASFKIPIEIRKKIEVV